MTTQQTILELEHIQKIIHKDFIPKASSLKEVIDNLRLTVDYLVFEAYGWITRE